ncbi:hypothetical protein [Paenibacillus medicaginis]|uniref:Uncharacterized protein n=1 Tax=Paenibacillus medicaginis TaxID=1470560 RepID=A0ABV5BYC0_9BACL
MNKEDLQYWNDIKKNKQRTNGNHLVPPEAVLLNNNYRMWIRHNFAHFFGDHCYSLTIDELIKRYKIKFEEVGFEWKYEHQKGIEYFKQNGVKISEFNKETGSVKEWHTSKEESYAPLLLFAKDKYADNKVLDNYKYDGHYSQERYEYINEWTSDSIIISKAGELLAGEFEIY